jgi:hypothetical protein
MASSAASSPVEVVVPSHLARPHLGLLLRVALAVLAAPAALAVSPLEVSPPDLAALAPSPLASLLAMVPSVLALVTSSVS